MAILRIATRKSALALVQANLVKTQLEQLDPSLQCILVPIMTAGDKATDVPLTEIGGKGLFIKALEVALLNDQADIAVHSMKDMTVFIPDELCLGAITERSDPRDAFVSDQYRGLNELPAGAVVGTISLRRRYQLYGQRRDIDVRDLRGNIDTRLKKLAAGEYQAIILAMAGLMRLDRCNHFVTPLSLRHFLPAPGQGALGIECRKNDVSVRALLAQLHHTSTAACVEAERQMMRALGGSCLVPVAAYADWMPEKKGVSPILRLRGEVGDREGRVIIKSTVQVPLDQSGSLGDQVAKDLLDQGAERIIQTFLT